MRITIAFDSADTASVRKLAVALHHVGLTETLQVGVNGPEHWSGSTPPLRPNEFARVAAELIKFHGEPVADILNELRSS